MSVSLSPDQARHLRWRAQGLAAQARTNATADETVRRLAAVQAQEERSAKLAIRPRSSGLTAAAVEAARVEERSIVRTWLLRGTLHLVAVEDFGWLRRLTGPQAIRSTARRYEQLGLDNTVYSEAARRLRDLLMAGGPHSRTQIVEQLGSSGVDLSGQRAPHLLRRAALEGWICLGPTRDRVETYVLVEDWLDVDDDDPQGDAALAEIARRYLAAYGPAEPRDLASWSGLSVRDARRGWGLISSELVEAEIGGKPGWMLASHRRWLADPPPSEPRLRLLPAYDPYLLGYRSRDLAVPPEYAREVHPGGGLLRPVVAVDGLAAGTWKILSSHHGPRVDISVFDATPRGEPEGLEAEIDDVIRFLEAGPIP